MMQLTDVKAYYDTPRGPVQAVDGVTLDIRENEVLSIAGESGCGKSTLVKVLYDYMPHPLRLVSGEILATIPQDNGETLTLREHEIRDYWWRHISYIPQASMSILNPVVRVERQFYDAAGGRYARGNRRELRKQIISYLRELELPEEVLTSFPHQLSGGMRQRVIVALATFMHPKIVLGDEPTTALDVVVQRGILTMLTRLQRQMQNTLVIVSHDMGVHYQISDRMAIMYAGKIVELGPTEALFHGAMHPYTDNLIKSLPRIGDRDVRTGIPGAPPSLLNPPKGCRFEARCPHVMDVCRREEPPFHEERDDHMVACHLF